MNWWLFGEQLAKEYNMSLCVCIVTIGVHEMHGRIHPSLNYFVGLTPFIIGLPYDHAHASGMVHVIVEFAAYLLYSLKF